ncbi:MAG: DUF2809 domain-containing protein [Chloroflexota bacterium]
MNLTRRLIYILLVPIVVAIGVVSRAVDFGSIFIDKYLGDALYAILLYLGFSILWSRSPIGWRGWGALIVVFAIECFQLTGIPRNLSQSNSLPLRILAIGLGTHFSWLDVAAYVVGVGIAVWTDLGTRIK